MDLTRDSLEQCLEAVASTHVLVIGDLMLDRYIWGDASRLSPEAPVPVVKIDRTTSVAGGAANVALNLRALGASASLFGSMGDDEAGASLRTLLDQAEIPLLPGSISSRCGTTVKTRVLCRRQQVCRLDSEDPPSAHTRTADDFRTALASLHTPPSALLLSDYAKGVLTTESVAFIQSLTPSQTLVAMDPKPRSSIAYSGLGLMTPNRSEALALAGLDDSGPSFPAEEACRRIYERYRPQRLDITLGAEGMLLAEEGHILDHIPTVAREVFDVSGAGDTAIAALTAALAGGIPYPQAARFANLAAGVVVGKLGTASATPAELRAALSLAAS